MILEFDLLFTEDNVMSVGTGLLILILLFVLRFGVPFVLTIMFGYLMERIHRDNMVVPAVD
jgi:hypothetical protein